MLSKHTGKASRSATWYRTIAELPLNKFIECACDDNLAALIISGFPSANDLKLAWADINEQYADTMGDKDHKMYVKLLKEITGLTIDYNRILLLIEILHVVKYAPFEAKLNELLFTNYQFTDDRRAKELEICKRLSKSLLVKIDMKTVRVNAIKSKQPDGAKPTRESYYAMLITLSDHARYMIPDTITVFDFCERINRYDQFVELEKQKELQRQNNGRR